MLSKLASAASCTITSLIGFPVLSSLVLQVVLAALQVPKMSRSLFYWTMACTRPWILNFEQIMQACGRLVTIWLNPSFDFFHIPGVPSSTSSIKLKGRKTCRVPSLAPH